MEPVLAKLSEVFAFGDEGMGDGVGCFLGFDGFSYGVGAEEEIDGEFIALEFVDVAPPIEFFVQGAYDAEQGNAGEEGFELCAIGHE